MRALLLGSGRAVLHDTLQSMIGPGSSLRACRLRRAHFKPGRKLTGYYDVTVEGDAHSTPIAVMWFFDGAPATGPELLATEQRLQGATKASGFDRLFATVASWRMLVQVAPFDPAFPSLGYLSDPRRVSEAQAACGGPSRRAAGPCGVRPIRYRPGQRHLLEYRGPRGRSIFAKLYRRGEACRVADVVSALGDLLDAAEVQGVRVVRPAAVWAETDAILYRQALGTPLSRGLRAGQPIDLVQLRKIGRLLRALHSSTQADDSQLPERNLENEISAINRACEAMRALRPEFGAAAARVLERSRERLTVLEQEPHTVVHGDMKADHLLVGPEGIIVLDADRCARADPAPDLGKLLADLRWWSWVSSRPYPILVEAEMLAGYGDAGPRVARARLYAALLLVKMAARRIPVASRDWAGRTADLLALASRAVDEGAAR